jgi:hypothetical protein
MKDLFQFISKDQTGVFLKSNIFPQILALLQRHGEIIQYGMLRAIAFITRVCLSSETIFFQKNLCTRNSIHPAVRLRRRLRSVLSRHHHFLWT